MSFTKLVTAPGGKGSGRGDEEEDGDKKNFSGKANQLDKDPASMRFRLMDADGQWLPGEWMARVGDVVHIPRQDGLYDHAIFIIEVRLDGSWIGMDFDPNETLPDQPTTVALAVGVWAPIRTITNEDFEEQYGMEDGTVGRTIGVERTAVAAGFEQRVAEFQQHVEEEHLYQVIPTIPGAMNCQTFINRLRTGEWVSPDANAAITALNVGLGNGVRVAQRSLNECVARAPWNPCNTDGRMGFVGSVGNGVANAGIAMIIGIIVILVFLVMFAVSGAGSYLQHRNDVIRGRDPDDAPPCANSTKKQA